MTDSTPPSERIGNSPDPVDAELFATGAYDDEQAGGRRASDATDAGGTGFTGDDAGMLAMSASESANAYGSFPWPPPENASILDAFMRTWHGATLQPKSFYRAVPAHAGLGATLLYYLPLGILVAGAELFWSTIRPPAVDEDSVIGSVAATADAISPLVSFLISPLVLLLSLFIYAAITHAMLKLFGGAHRDFGFTTRVCAFAYSPMVFTIIPVVGMPIAFVWVVVVSIIGLREGHRTSTGRAAAAVLVPVFILGVLFALVTFVAVTSALLQLPL